MRYRAGRLADGLRRGAQNRRALVLNNPFLAAAASLLILAVPLFVGWMTLIPLGALIGVAVMTTLVGLLGVAVSAVRAPYWLRQRRDALRRSRETGETVPDNLRWFS